MKIKHNITRLMTLSGFVKRTINIYEAEEQGYRIAEYDLDLDKDLKKGMFVPCDKDDNILEMPLGYMKWLTVQGGVGGKGSYSSSFGEYKKAEDKVIFSGVELKMCTPKVGDNPKEFVGVTINGQWCGGWKHWISSYLMGDNTVRGLINLNEKLTIELK